MAMDPSIQPFVRSLVSHLYDEERLLLAVIQATESLQATLRHGDVASFREVQANQADSATQLATIAAARSTVMLPLAEHFKIPHNRLTLRILAEKLSPPESDDLRILHGRLLVAATSLKRVQAQTANLLVHLRSYFRNVLSTLAVSEATERYGPTGSRLGTGSGMAIQACG